MSEINLSAEAVVSAYSAVTQHDLNRSVYVSRSLAVQKENGKFNTRGSAVLQQPAGSAMTASDLTVAVLLAVSDVR